MPAVVAYFPRSIFPYLVLLYAGDNETTLAPTPSASTANWPVPAPASKIFFPAISSSLKEKNFL